MVSEFPNSYCDDPRMEDRKFVNRHSLQFGSTTGLWTTPDGKIMVPEPLVQKVLHAHHASPLAGHTGKDKTLELLSRYFFWPGMSDAVRMDTRPATR